MVLSLEDIEDLLKVQEDLLAKELKAKNPAGIAKLYHPDAVIVHKGLNKVAYGREEIEKTYQPFVESTEEFEVRPTYAESSADGQYLIRRGYWSIAGSSKEFPFEQIYKKHEGKYLIYHDEFSQES
ncbi:hypothetical protein M3Y97_01009700 [Aphelenchoides bicaudatus]|nr:hypothetical protein M3Y97_01009700 [Aphelenchoides bicaudatus]